MMYRLGIAGLSIACLIEMGIGGEIHPALHERLQSTGESDPVNIVVRLRDRVDVAALSAGLKANKATRQERHYTVVTALQQKATATQGALLTFLSEQQRAGLVQKYESFWIENQISSTVLPSLIEQLAAREDVETVFLEPDVIYDEPLDLDYSPDQTNSSELGLRLIHADYLWRIGIAGQGRLVMNIDTGVKGDHVALGSRWRGTLPGVLPQHAWYNGSGGTFPVDSDNPGHGTHTMGIMTGMNSGTSDTVGVAPAAYWIAGTGSYTGAFQWALNPDGGNRSVDDVPDVINCSWFTNGDACTGGSNYWSLMDNVEAAGVAVIWSAGNCGPTGSQTSCAEGTVPGSYKTITPPKNRVTSDINAFAVGALDGNTLNIAGFSSRGPSACDTAIIKPEVSAPGASVRSTYANGGFGTLSGTSMAAPHVAGAVALLRQINPDADVETIKYALLNTARDLGPTGEDNSYGRGIIDVFAAAEVLTNHDLTGNVMQSGSFTPLQGVKVAILETLQARNTDSNGNYALRPLKDTIQVRFTKFAYYDTTIAVIVSPDIPETLNVTMTPLPLASISGIVRDSLTSTGIPAELQFYAEGDPSGVATHTTTSQPNGSYALQAVVGTYRIEVVPPAPYSDKIVVSSFNLTASGAILDFGILKAEILLVDDDGGKSYDTLYQQSFDNVIHLRRRTVGSAAFDSAVAAFAPAVPVVWFTGNDSANALTPSERLQIVRYLSQGGRAIITGQNIAQFAPVGDTLLEKTLGIQYNGLYGSFSLRGFQGDVIGDGIVYSILGGAGNQTSKDILALIGGSTGYPVKTLYYGNVTDTANIAGVRVDSNPDGGWAVAYFGFGLEGLTAARRDTLLIRSLRFFDQTVVGVHEPVADGVPGQYTLEQNYPNPFNPSTNFGFRIVDFGFVSIKVYDVLGREVRTLVNEKLNAGEHRITFNADGLPSGVYIYRIQAGRYSASRKMLLLK